MYAIIANFFVLQKNINNDLIAIIKTWGLVDESYLNLIKSPIGLHTNHKLANNKFAAI